MDVSPPLPDQAPAPEHPHVTEHVHAPADWRADLSPEVRTLAEIALSHALEIVVASGSPMLPFTVLEDDGGRVLARFEGEPLAAVERARAHARASAARRAAVAWDGWLTVGGVRQDAVVVHTSDRGRPGVVVAHRYKETLEGTVAVGRPVLVGPGDPVL
ncbi:MAG: hypothetical protein GX609_10245 [Actinomycetales bacterium]|jgi:hypothetical protein|nr:hypothetical protein [Actinomycetales bacterium]